MENEFRIKVIGWCGYCHGSIYVGDDYVVENEIMYHPECKKQKNLYIDSFDLTKDG